MSESTLTTAIVESDNFIILEKYTKIEQPSQYQTEADLEIGRASCRERV